MTEGARTPKMTPEIEQVLTRYLEIQREAKALSEEKAALQDTLREHLADAPGATWHVTLAGMPLRVRHVEATEVTYDEALLKQRLGERYVRILKPDWRKIRQHLDEVGGHLEPVLGRIGSPDRDKVREAVEDGLVSPDEFAGAFEKETVTHIAVMRDRSAQH